MKRHSEAPSTLMEDIQNLHLAQQTPDRVGWLATNIWYRDPAAAKYKLNCKAVFPIRRSPRL
jgi:hypothetical protein